MKVPNVRALVLSALLAGSFWFLCMPCRLAEKKTDIIRAYKKLFFDFCHSRESGNPDVFIEVIFSFVV